MPEVELEHFAKAAADIAAYGDNDTLPFDIDTRFISDTQSELSEVAYGFYEQLQSDSVANSKSRIKDKTVFSERLLAPAGPAGFRVATKIQPFWNLYFNGLGVAIANAHEPHRDTRAHSYWLNHGDDPGLFDRHRSWRSFREQTVADVLESAEGTIVVQTDIGAFYESISHHHIDNFIQDLYPGNGRIAAQIVALLSKFSAGRSFGLPVGGQCSRVLAELFLSYVDRRMAASGVRWHRYVDDYVLIAGSNADAYRSLSVLSHALADYGLTLSRTKTIFLTAKHYADYVRTQLGLDDSEAGQLREIDLHFDPYSDTAVDDYDSLRQTVESLDIQKLLNRELEKALPDTFLVTQIGRTLRLHRPETALQLVTTLLSPGNLHAFRASWATIMRGVANLRSTGEFAEIFDRVDGLIDRIPMHSEHLLQAEASLLHYLRALRVRPTPLRRIFVLRTFNFASTDTIRRACMDCWRHWQDRDAFTQIQNRWGQLSAECQRMAWLSSYALRDQGDALRRLHRPSIARQWALGVERQGVRTYSDIYRQWCEDAQASV